MKPMEKLADALQRAIERGDVRVDTAKQKLILDEKLRKLAPRNSGNSGLLVKRPFASGAEGDAYLAGNRGNGLAVQKVFVGVRPGHENQYYANLKTRNVELRAKLMAAHPDVFPKIYSHIQHSTDPAKGMIDMEYIHGPGIDAAHRGGYRNVAMLAHKELVDTMESKGYEYNRANYNPLFRKGNAIIGDVHGGNIVLDIKDGMKAKIIDPMYYHAQDPGLRGNPDMYFGPTLDKINNPNRDAREAEVLSRDVYKKAPAFSYSNIDQSAIPRASARSRVRSAMSKGDIAAARRELEPGYKILYDPVANAGPVRRMDTEKIKRMVDASQLPEALEIKNRHFYNNSFNASLFSMQGEHIKRKMPASDPIDWSALLRQSSNQKSMQLPSKSMSVSIDNSSMMRSLPNGRGSIPVLSAQPSARVSNVAKVTGMAEDAASSAHSLSRFNMKNLAKAGVGAAALGALAYGGYRLRNAFMNRDNKDS